LPIKNYIQVGYKPTRQNVKDLLNKLKVTYEQKQEASNKGKNCLRYQCSCKNNNKSYGCFRDVLKAEKPIIIIIIIINA